MAILVHIEFNHEKVTNSSLESLSFANKLSYEKKEDVHAVVFNPPNKELKTLYNHGVSVAHCIYVPEKNLFFTKYLFEKINKLELDVSIYITAYSPVYKDIGGYYSANKGIVWVTGVLGDLSSRFNIVRSSCSGQADETWSTDLDSYVITLAQNTTSICDSVKDGKSVKYEYTDVLENSFVKKQEGQSVSLENANIIVAGGMGLKSKENFSMIEELASLLSGVVACSRPVAEEGWRPHDEHVGQTGKVVAPKVYIAVAISGAIQHLAGISKSKVKIAINKDPNAPIFKAVDYGIVGDAFIVIEKIIKTLKK